MRLSSSASRPARVTARAAPPSRSIWRPTSTLPVQEPRGDAAVLTADGERGQSLRGSPDCRTGRPAAHGRLVHQRQHLVALLEAQAAARDDDPPSPHDRAHDGVARERQFLDRPANRDRARRQRFADERVASASELEQGHHLAERHLLLDQAREDIGLVQRTSTWTSRRKARVVRVVDRGDRARHAEPLARDEAERQRVGVVGEGGHEDVALAMPASSRVRGSVASPS